MSQPPRPPAKCAAHQALAGWECTHCHAPLCPDCAAVKVVTPVSLVACGLCGNFAEPLLRRKSEGQSLARRLPAAFTFPFHGEGLPAFLGISLWLAVTALPGLAGVLIGWCATLGSLFGLARSTARGGEHLELGGGGDLFHGVIQPALRFALAMAPAWVLGFLAVRTGASWAWWLALGLTVLWFPTAFIGAAVEAGVLDMLNPLRVLRAAVNLGADFGVYLGAMLGISLVTLAGVVAGVLLQALPYPLLPTLVAQPLMLYGPFVGARIAGLVLHLYPHVFGWGDSMEAFEPVLPGVEPRGALPQKRTLPAHLPDAIELEPEAPKPSAPAPDRFAAIELGDEAPRGPVALDAALLPSHAEQAAAEIRKAILRGDHDGALDGFRATGLTAAEALTVDELVWVGQAASSRIDFESAELAFARAAERRGEPEVVGKARVMLGRLLVEKRGRVDEGARWMERVVAEQPGTQAAAFARQWLAARR